MVKRLSLQLRYLSGLLPALVLFCITPAHAQDDQLRIELRRMIGHDTEIEYSETPGFVVGLVDRDTSFVVDFGYADKEGTSRLHDSITFEIGSLSKIMTAGAVLHLAEEGVIALDSSINDYLPDRYSNPRMHHKTVRDLLQHTSGLPKRPSSFGIKNKDPQDPYRYYTKSDLLEFYDEFLPPKDRRRSFSYSHVNYALLEVIIEQVTGDNFEMILDRLLWGPLGMDDTYIALPENTSTVAAGYDHAGNATAPWTFSSFAGSEGVKSTMRDLIQLMQAYLSSDSKLHDIVYPSWESSVKSTLGKNTYSGMGWHILKSKKTPTIIMHSGMTSGHHCYIAAVPSTRTAAIVLSNSVIGTEDLCLLALRMINYNWQRRT